VIVVQRQMSNISGIDHGDQTPLVAMIEVSLLQKWLYLMHQMCMVQINLCCSYILNLAEALYHFFFLF
jgi:hypothetical protein